MTREIRSDSVTSGWNAERVPFVDSRYVRCARCGWINHLDRQDVFHEGSKVGWGTTQPATTLDGAVAADATTITVVSTDGFSSAGSIIIYETGLPYSSLRPVSDKVDYTGITSNSFTGCTSVLAHSTGKAVCGEQVVTGGCVQCGTFLYDK